MEWKCFVWWISAQAWGHFIVDTTERLWPLFNGNNALNVDAILFFAEDARLTDLNGNFEEFFTLLGIKDKVKICHDKVSVEHLFVPDTAFEHPKIYSKGFYSVFDALRRKCGVAGRCLNENKKLFLTRSQLPHAEKFDINIKELDRLFADNGFELISPEKLSLREFVDKVSDAKCVASISGTLAHNFLFCNKESEFIIVERTAANNEYQVGLNLIMGIRPTYIDAFRIPLPQSAVDPFHLFSKTGQMIAFIRDKGWIDNDTFPADLNARARELRQFMRIRRSRIAYEMRFFEWELREAICIAEACSESQRYYEPWIVGKKPLHFSDTFRRPFIRNLAKQMFLRVKGWLSCLLKR
ncbi:MAG: glycosyltransferase family 61 protein [Bacteroidales bacterium]|nr:glycosyltransferase family 61 protein [Bacteroidales bacterium]